jgi:large subunit ribosomal protein L7/L12
MLGAQQKRATETRKKILIGAAIQSMIERGQWSAENLQKIMDQALTRDDDRALFGLSPKVPVAG